MVNSYIKLKTATKKLQFGTEKCKKMHIGKTNEECKCQNLFIDKWEEKEMESCDSKNFQIVDTYEGEEIMEEKESERYLGDIISKDGRNSKKQRDWNCKENSHNVGRYTLWKFPLHGYLHRLRKEHYEMIILNKYIS